MLDIELIRKMSEIGYMACFRGFTQEGEAIMEGIQAEKPDQIPVLIGLAVAKIAATKHKEAVEILQGQVLSRDPENMTAQCFLALALKESGQESKADELLRNVDSHGNEYEKAVANAYLQA